MSQVLERFPIRWRLAATSALLTFVILGVFAVVIGELTTRRIRSDFDNQLVAATDTLAQNLKIRVSDSPLGLFGRINVTRVDPNLDAFAASEHAAIRLSDGSSGTFLAGTRNPPDFGAPTSAALVTIGDYKVASRIKPVSTGFDGAGYVVVQYGRRLSDLEATVRRVRAFLFFGVLAGTLIALAAGLVLARRAMKPIADLTRTSREIAATRDPNRRVPIGRSADEVSELARTLDQMLVSLEAARSDTAESLVRQRQFVADASHELRTPLTSVYANLELLAETLHGEERDAAASALRSTQRMKRLVADLLLLARADARREVPHVPVDVSRVVVDAAAELGPVAADHEIVVDVDQGLRVSGVRDDLYRLVLNLMHNAVEHTPPGTTVTASVHAPDDRHVSVEVADDGPGIDPELRDHLFERFVRGTGDRGGSTGLGLAIVKAVADEHGAQLSVADALEPRTKSLLETRRGTRFSVRLPALRDADDAEATEEHVAARS